MKNRILKSVLSLALAGVLLMGDMGMAFAKENTNISETVQSEEAVLVEEVTEEDSLVEEAVFSEEAVAEEETEEVVVEGEELTSVGNGESLGYARACTVGKTYTQIACSYYTEKLMAITVDSTKEIVFKVVGDPYGSTSQLTAVLGISIHKAVKDGVNYTCITCLDQAEVDMLGDFTYEQSFLLEEGTYVLKMFAPIYNDSFRSTVSFTDVTQYATSVTVPTSMYLNKGENKQLAVSNILPAGAVAGITWKSDNTAVATVNKNGTVTGVATGSCNITATLTNGVSYVCKVYVEDPKFDFNTCTLLKGDKYTIPLRNVYQAVTYTSSNPTVATVNATTGEVVAKSAGTTTITATMANKTYQYTLKVEAPKLNVTTKTVIKGDTLKLKLSGTTRDDYIWETSNSKIATVTEDGVVTTKKAGKVKISAVILGMEKSTKYTCTINVQDTKLKTTSVKVVTGKTAQVKLKSKIKNVKWSTDNKKIATVNKNGVVTGKKAGETKVYAKIGKIKYPCVVVCENPKISNKKISMENKSTYALKVTGTTMKVTWKSKNKGIASVNNKGVVTAKKAGTTQITATVGGKKLTCKVTVKRAEPKYSVWMSDDAKASAVVVGLWITNKGGATMRVTNDNAWMNDSEYDTFDRNLYMIDEDVNSISYTDIPAGTTRWVWFAVEGNKTWYDKKTTVYYTFTYDGVTYRGSSSSYYGSRYSVSK